MKLKVVLALSTALAATPAIANPLSGALQSLGDGMSGNGNSTANNGNGSGNALTDGLNSGALSPQGGEQGSNNADRSDNPSFGDRRNSGNGDDANPLAGLQPGQEGSSGNFGGDGNEDPITIENEDDRLIISLRHAGLQPDQEGSGDNTGNGGDSGDGDASPLAGLQPDQEGSDGPFTEFQPDQEGNNGDSGDGDASPLAGLQPDQEGNDGDSGGNGDEDPITIENEDDRLIVGVRLDGRGDRFNAVHEDFVPFFSTDAELWPEGIRANVYAEESDDWMRIKALLSQDRSFLDIEGEGDERLDTETERDLFGFWN